MWENCYFDYDCKTELRYLIDENNFSVECRSNYHKFNESTELVAYFDGDSNAYSFEIGTFTKENEQYKLYKTYSISYLKSIKIDPSQLSYFLIDGSIKAYPENVDHELTDKSVLRARELLESIKGNKDYKKDAIDTVDYINKKITSYNECKLPFLSEFKWYIIDNINENFNATSLKHILKSEGFVGEYSSWYFAKSSNDRLYAAAVKCENNALNPFSNANDCTLLFTDTNNSCIYYVVGILFLDDGQYFCRLN